MKKLYFVRHGLSKFNRAGRIAGVSDSKLTLTGKKQAKSVGRQAKDLGIDCIVSSPSKRALKTAQIIARQIGYPTKQILVNRLLMERDFGPLEGKPWHPGLNFEDLEGAETEDAVLERASQALRWIQGLEGDTILVVSHGTTGRALRSLVNPNYTMNHHGQLNNAELYQWHG